MKKDGLSREEIALCLGCDLLNSCSPATFLEIATSSAARWEFFPAGTVVYDPAHFQRSLGVLLEGQLQVTKGGLSVSVLSPGELFGAAALYSDCARFATTITAKKDSRCLLLSQKLVDQMIARDAKFRECYLRYLTGRIHFLSARLDALAPHGTEERLGRYLLANVGENGTLTSSATDLAKRLGISRASLYRAFEVLEDSGLILREGKTITIPDPAALRAACD